jgi:oligopeptide/dipeptide ABC transporter ATP-binding protein
MMDGSVTTEPLVRAIGLTKTFPIESNLMRRKIGEVKAVDRVDLEIAPGETVGLVGESGSGKSTLARLILKIIEPTGGEVWLDGEDVTKQRGAALRDVRREVQAVFQDPYSSFDPTATIGESLREPLQAHLGLSGKEQRKRVAELFELVRLPAGFAERYPNSVSGGQLQRAAIARALAISPKLLVLDEPVTALDMSTQAQILNLLADLQRELGVAYLLIAHDLAIVAHVSEVIAVMYLGRIVERGPAISIITKPRHPYTEALLSAIPVPNPVRQRQRNRIVLEGDVPSPANPPRGCHFHTRCAYAMEICSSEEPPDFLCDDGTKVACHLHTSGPVLAGAPLTTIGEPRAD